MTPESDISDISPAAAEMLVAFTRYGNDGVEAAELRDSVGAGWPNARKRGGLLALLVSRGLIVKDASRHKLTDAGWAQAGRHA